MCYSSILTIETCNDDDCSALAVCAVASKDARHDALCCEQVLGASALARRTRPGASNCASCVFNCAPTAHVCLSGHLQVAQLQELSQAKVKALLGVSDALAKLNYQRYERAVSSRPHHLQCTTMETPATTRLTLLLHALLHHPAGSRTLTPRPAKSRSRQASSRSKQCWRSTVQLIKVRALCVYELECQRSRAHKNSMLGLL